MRKKHFLFAALFFAALSLGFVSCENPDDEPGFSLENVGQDDANSDKENAEGSTDGDGTTPSTSEAPTLVATGGATDVEYSSVTLWGRINTDTLWAFPNIKWGIEYAYDYATVAEHKHQETTKVLCSTPLQGENVDEFSVEISGIEQRKIYYSAYILINDMKYIYGEVDSVHLDVKLTVNRNNSSYGTVTGSGTYDYLAEITITATPKENYYFTGWSDCDSKELTRTVQVNSDTTITANFAKNPYLTAKPNNSNYGTVTGSGYYEPNTEVVITAIPNPNPNYDYIIDIEFVQWSDGNTENPRTITVTSDVTYTATFKVNLPDGAFLVNSNGKGVYFSLGNLQYTQSTNTWSFAENQWEVIGTDNVTGGEVTSDLTEGDFKYGTALADKIDLFGWSAGATNFGVSTSKDYNDYSGSFVDWGTNQIGSDAPNTWRTLTDDEWDYLLNTRTNASSLKGVAQVNGVNGLILLPDSWTCPEGVTFKSGFHSSSCGSSYYAAYQTFTAAEWSKMEAAGAVFLPAAGERFGSDVYYVQYYGNYWSATERSSNLAEGLVFRSCKAYTSGFPRRYGLSVRLVKDL